MQSERAAIAQPTPEQLLERCGLSAFRPGQREAVQAALQGRDSLVVMPTGGGKSLCYQLPALADVGLVVVVSPLIALMADQRRRMEEAGVRVAMLASGMEEGHNARALAAIADGQAQLVLVAPERFASRAFREALARRRVGLFAVDEAHCVAEWGHDFRPDYLRLRGAIQSLEGDDRPHAVMAAQERDDRHPAVVAAQAREDRRPDVVAAQVRDGRRPAVMATTATATPRVAKEIAARLGLRDWLAVRSGFDRPNLSFDVVGIEGKGAVARKRALLLRVLGDARARPAIVYCGTRKDTEEVARLLREQGLSAVAYHAGMPGEARAASQAAFMEGDADVVVATNAFGMGVDKADVRTVAHWAIPTSLEGYYQEAGRAGRDGEPARALLLAARHDLGRLIHFNTQRDTTVDDVRAFVARLRRSAERSLGQAGVSGDGAGSPGRAGPGRAGTGRTAQALIAPGELDDRERLLLSIAERAGAAVLEPGPAGSLLVQLTGRGSPRAAHAAIKAAKDRGWESYRAIERFISNASVCRRRQILDHFGDSEPCAPHVRCCDVCEPDSQLRAPTATAAAHSGADRAAPAPERYVGPVDQRQLERLKAWRLERAEGKPAYVVASNATLEAILRARPANLEALLAVKGVGPVFCERHGESLLQALRELASEVAPT